MSFIKQGEDQMLKSLLAYGFDYAQSLCAKYSNSLKFTQLLFNFYQSYNRSLDLLQWSVLQQVQTTSHAEELFREGSTATNLLTHLFHHDQMGTKYLHIVVGPLVQQLLAHPTISKVEKADVNADQNLELLFAFLEEFLERLRNTVLSCPLYIRELFLFFKKNAEAKFPECKVVVSSVLFLRFIMPALITPQNYGIWHETPAGQKGLILAARILQSIANMCEVEQVRWSNYSKLNCFIVRMLPKMEAYISTLLSEEKIRKAKLVIEATISFKPNIGEREAAVRDLMRFLEEDEDKTATLQRVMLLSNAHKTPQEMQRRLLELNMDENWKLQKTKKGCSLYSLRSEETPVAIFKVVSEVECPYSVLFNRLWNIGENTEFHKYAHPYIVDTHVLKKISDVEVDYYQSLNFPFPISRRDVTFKCYGIKGGNLSSSLITTYSIIVKDCPARKGYTRIDAQMTGYIIEPIDATKCKLTCLNYLDLKGSLPLWMKNLVGFGYLYTPIHIAKWCKEHPCIS
jgi:hypothetical protein